MAAASADSGGERVGKQEGVAGELTTARFGAEDGRRKVVGGEGGARRGASMVDGVCRLNSAVEQLNQARDEAEEVEGKVKRGSGGSGREERRPGDERRPALRVTS